MDPPKRCCSNLSFIKVIFGIFFFFVSGVSFSSIDYFRSSQLPATDCSYMDVIFIKAQVMLFMPVTEIILVLQTRIITLMENKVGCGSGWTHTWTDNQLSPILIKFVSITVFSYHGLSSCFSYQICYGITVFSYHGSLSCSKFLWNFTQTVEKSTFFLLSVDLRFLRFWFPSLVFPDG